MRMTGGKLFLIGAFVFALGCSTPEYRGDPARGEKSIPVVVLDEARDRAPSNPADLVGWALALATGAAGGWAEYQRRKLKKRNGEGSKSGDSA